MLALQKSRPQQSAAHRVPSQSQSQNQNQLTLQLNLTSQKRKQQRQQPFPVPPVVYPWPAFGAHTVSRSSDLSSQLRHFRSSAGHPLLSNAREQPNVSSSATFYRQHLRKPHPAAATISQHLEPSAQIRLLAQAQLEAQVQQNRSLMIQQQPNHQQYHEASAHMSLLRAPPNVRKRPPSRPLCRCRVMYLGSSVPHVSKNGLHGIQEPLRHLYPEEQFARSQARVTSKSSVTGGQTIDISHLSAGLGGIDSWLSVWSNGLLLENFDELGREVKRFFAIESLHYCAAVRFFDTANLTSHQQTQNDNPQPSTPPTDQNNNSIESQQAGNLLQSRRARFLPLDAPIFGFPAMLDANHPPVFAAIMRRTTGIKVLECHAFICRRDAAANALVRCCTHAYSDHLNARRILPDQPSGSAPEICSVNNQQQRRPSARIPNYNSASNSSSVAPIYEAPASFDEPIECRGDENFNTIDGKKVPRQTVDKSEEANYAVISRGTRRASKDENGSITNKQQAKLKGSSRSLYTDFQTPLSDEQNDDQQTSSIREKESSGEMTTLNTYNQSHRLSHSLENVLDPALSATCCPGLESTVKDGDRNRYEKGARGATKRKERHSRSMQDLENGAAHFPAMMLPQHAPSSSSRKRTGHSSKSRRSSRSRDSGSRRRSASVHEIQLIPLNSSSSKRNQEPQLQPKQKSQVPQATPTPSTFRNDPKQRAEVHSLSRERRRLEKQAYKQQQQLASSMHRLYPATRPPSMYPPPGPMYLTPALYLNPFMGAPHLDMSVHSAGYPTNYPALSAAVGYPVGTISARRFSAKSASKNRKCQTLARFRCLSPPANFGLMSSGPSVSRADEAVQVGSSSVEEGGTVVSAEPGFMARRTERPSWIKRLSLLSVSSSQSKQLASNASETAHHSREELDKKKELSGTLTSESGKKRRSRSLFAGSLTLGRRQGRADRNPREEAATASSIVME